jgi:GNAT superfamily N-acetyltransferase
LELNASAKETEKMIRAIKSGDADICEAILRSLPDWFGIEESIVRYRREVEQFETYVAEIGGAIAGFLTVVQHKPHIAEIHVMAVRPQYHRQGIGRLLVSHIEQLLVERGTDYLEVKTLGPSGPDEFYRRTREFYLAMGFAPIEETNLWGAENPCLIMIKDLRQ